MNGNQQPDFQDVVLLFGNLGEIGANPERNAHFDVNGDDRFDFRDVTGLFERIRGPVRPYKNP